MSIGIQEIFLILLVIGIPALILAAIVAIVIVVSSKK